MKNITIKTSILGMVVIALFAFAPKVNKLTTTKTHIKFFSTTAAENIEANNYKSVSTVNTQTGDVVFSVPMQSFEFEKSLMQKHFNSSKFLDTKQFPKAKLIGKITNLSEINFEKEGSYIAQVSGTLEMHGKSNPIKEKATITVKGGIINASSKFNITLSDYEIAFEKGKPSRNIAKTVEITMEAEYKKEN